MTKVLGKSFSILEAVAEASPGSVQLAELTSALKMNKATCSRLARELVEMGYLEQRSRSGGFMIGPRAWSLGRQARFEEELREAAEAPVMACAKALKQSALLSILRKGERYILTHFNFNPEIRLDLRKVSTPDAFNTSTGMVLLAFASDAEFEAAKERRSEPLSHCWKKGFDARKDEILAKIRKDELFIFDDPVPYWLSSLACPVFKDGKAVAAVGASMPREDFARPGRRAEAIKEVCKAAALISAKLSRESAP